MLLVNDDGVRSSKILVIKPAWSTNGDCWGIYVVIGQQNTSRVELNGTIDELLSLWGIMGHHNLQQMFKGHWNRNSSLIL